jgi:hypothetical protein
MRIIVAGSREITDRLLIFDFLDQVSAANKDTPITEVVSGGAKGVDQIGEDWAREHNIPVKQFLAQWNIHGKSAGPIRNKEMAEYADALIAFWDGQSKGTKNMIEQMDKLNKLVIQIDKEGRWWYILSGKIRGNLSLNST